MNVVGLVVRDHCPLEDAPARRFSRELVACSGGSYLDIGADGFLPINHSVAAINRIPAAMLIGQIEGPNHRIGR